MCFSAGASFGASAVIGVISVACFAKANSPAQRIWACVPLFFSMQQFLEGLLWLSLINTSYRYLYSTGLYGFLLFAQVIWPIMVPVAAFASEPEGMPKKILKAFLVVGVAVAAFHLYGLLSQDMQAVPQPDHIQYHQSYSEVMLLIGNVGYGLAALLPLFISSLKPVRLLGVVMVCAYVLSRIFYQNSVISVWCYFAAILSGMVFLIIVQIGKTAAINRSS